MDFLEGANLSMHRSLWGQHFRNNEDGLELYWRKLFDFKRPNMSFVELVINTGFRTCGRG